MAVRYQNLLSVCVRERNSHALVAQCVTRSRICLTVSRDVAHGMQAPTTGTATQRDHIDHQGQAAGAGVLQRCVGIGAPLHVHTVTHKAVCMHGFSAARSALDSAACRTCSTPRRAPCPDLPAACAAHARIFPIFVSHAASCNASTIQAYPTIKQQSIMRTALQARMRTSRTA